VVGCSEWVKGRIGGHVDILGRGSVAQGGFWVCVGRSCREHIATRTRMAMRLDAGPPRSHGRRLTECFMPSCV